MAKRKPKPTAAKVLVLVQDAADLVETVQRALDIIALYEAQIADLNHRADAAAAGACKRVRRAQARARALPPGELAELLSKAPAWLRETLIKEMAPAS